MKTLYFDLNMGAAGDMLMAALLELVPDKQAFLDKMHALNLPGVRISATPSTKCGIVGTHVSVTVGGEEEESQDVDAVGRGHGHEHEHAHGHDHQHDHGDGHDHGHEHDHEHGHHHDHEREHDHDHNDDHGHHHDHDAHDHGHDHHHEHDDHNHDHEHEHSHEHVGIVRVKEIIDGLEVPDKVRADALAVYMLIAEAEAEAHQRPIDQVHFHEIGSMDAIADVVGVCLLMDQLAPQQVVASPVHVGSGQVKCAHGILPVPAPATAHILRGVPTYGGAIRGELCTPTGAALLKHFVTSFTGQPVMQVHAIGYGMGKKDFPAANCVRAFLGETVSAGDDIVELQSNLDDMTPEALGFAQERLWAAGALDVYTIPIGMKKSRPGTLLGVLCRPDDREAIVKTLFAHTTTLGIREHGCRRYTLNRRQETRETPHGAVRVKVSEGWGVRREKAEYDDLKRIAEEQGMSLAQAARLVEKEQN